MSGGLQPEAVTVLTAILDHLDIPMYVEGDMAGRKLWRDRIEQRVADVVGMLHGLLSIAVEDAADVAQELRTLASQDRTSYATTDERGA
ncbi:hypothetical protein [Streptomyces sp. NPDC008139]|uniref:hypothetical protein n=1 Tax=Streptomyces sp. NPDC008139 TaxID=3364814 RepID=UPI0036ED8CCF